MNAPLVCGHRGGRYTENTILGFEKALEAGIRDIETDVQLSVDGQVVICHDPNTKRIFGDDHLIENTELEVLQQLKAQDGSTMPTFKETLEWLMVTRNNPAYKDAKIMMDIKRTNPTLILVKMWEVMAEVHKDMEYWKECIQFGVWTLDFFRFGHEAAIFKGFEVINITFDYKAAAAMIDWAEKNLPEEDQLHGVSLQYVSTWTDEFAEFAKSLEKKNIKFYVWTVNSENDAKYCVQLGAHGIITDYPDDAQKWVENAASKEVTPLMKKIGRPTIVSREGARFYFFLGVYKLTTIMFQSKIARTECCGYSLNYLLFWFLRKIHFV